MSKPKSSRIFTLFDFLSEITDKNKCSYNIVGFPDLLAKSSAFFRISLYSSLKGNGKILIDSIALSFLY